MAKRVYCEKKTKIYIPKTVNPQIITYNYEGTTRQNLSELLYRENIEEFDSKKTAGMQ